MNTILSQHAAIELKDRMKQILTQPRNKTEQIYLFIAKHPGCTPKEYVVGLADEMKSNVVYTLISWLASKGFIKGEDTGRKNAYGEPLLKFFLNDRKTYQPRRKMHKVAAPGQEATPKIQGTISVPVKTSSVAKATPEFQEIQEVTTNPVKLRKRVIKDVKELKTLMTIPDDDTPVQKQVPGDPFHPVAMTPVVSAPEGEVEGVEATLQGIQLELTEPIANHKVDPYEVLMCFAIGDNKTVEMTPLEAKRLYLTLGRLFGNK